MPTYFYKCDVGHELEDFEPMSAPTTRPCKECEDAAVLTHSPVSGSGMMERVFKVGQPPIIKGGTPKFHGRG
jgi:predicted nucleic acid-binding Zn ribbon protein